MCRSSRAYARPIAVLSFAMCLWAPADGRPEADWSMETLMGLLKEHGHASVPFEEATYSSLLTEPVTARGVLKFVPPARLEKIITAPSRERYVVEGDVRVLDKRVRVNAELVDGTTGAQVWADRFDIAARAFAPGR